MKTFIKNWLLFLLIIFAVVSVVLQFVFEIFSNSDWILFLTFLALLWYADETRKMKREMEYQNIHHYSPYLIAGIDEQRFYVKNLGPGIALNVSVNILNRNTHPKYKGEFFLLQTAQNNIDSLLGGEEKDYIYQYRNGLKSTFTELVGDIEIEIKYFDKLLKNIYMTVVKISCTDSKFYNKKIKSIVKKWKIENNKL